MTTFEKIRNAALARLDAGEDLEHILQDYADFEDDLRPILEAAAGVYGERPGSTPRPLGAAKIKPKREATSNVPIYMIAAGVVVLIALAIVVFALIPQGEPMPQPMPVVTAIVATEAPLVPPTIDLRGGAPNNGGVGVTSRSCATLDEQQITSTYALQWQQSTGNNIGSVSGSGGDDAVRPPVDIEIIELPEGASGDADVEYTTRELGASEEEEAGLVPEAPLDMDMEMDRAESASEPAAPPMPGGALGTHSSAPVMQQATEPMRAGEIDDNAEWDTYQAYRRDYLDQYGTFAVRDLDTTDRQLIAVTTPDGQPVLGACVEVYNGDNLIAVSRTYATGMTMFFPNLSDNTRYVETFNVRVLKDGTSATATIDRSAIGGVTNITLDTEQAAQSVMLDVVFLLDATGSMADEIAQLQNNIVAISDQIDALPGDVDARYGLVIYRDRGDQYVTRTYDFVSDVAAFQENLLLVRADGGGDYPESLNEGFDMALNAVNWRGEDAVKLVFLVADAPPHVDYQNDADYSQLMQTALARGIKVHSIASSGLQPEGEFVLRQISQVTMGRFIFLTYEGGVAGTPGDDRPDLEVGEAKDEQGVGDYSVSQLDELVLRLITDEIAALRGQ